MTMEFLGELRDLRRPLGAKTLEFRTKLAELQRSLAQCHDMVTRRHKLMRVTKLELGESLLDVGCGGGYDAFEAAKFVGPNGRIRAVDISEDQILTACERCDEFDWVSCQIGDAVKLPFGDASFDVVTFNQVLEYVEDAEEAVHEAWRVLKPGGRLLCIGVNISSFVWRTDDKKRMREMLDAWESHAPHPDLPSILGSMLHVSKFKDVERTPMPILNTSFRETGFSYWLAEILPRFAVEQNIVSEALVTEWVRELEELDRRGDYFFSSLPILTKAVK